MQGSPVVKVMEKFVIKGQIRGQKEYDRKFFNMEVILSLGRESSFNKALMHTLSSFFSKSAVPLVTLLLILNLLIPAIRLL
jgi:hypothetical protein